jgi:hypothetical protein
MATRQQIRTAIKQLLSPNFTTTFDYRPSQIFEEDLPSCSVYFNDGDTDYDFSDEGVTTGRLVVEIIARDGANLDAKLDNLGTLVSVALKSDNPLNQIIEDIKRTGFAYDRDPESNSGGLSLIHAVHYYDED